ncbi:MAG: putative baseplate assembly protein [Methylococcales bacterium]|nr:putative baseplate assembly protein [Methylococcales bacterium]
MTTQIPKIDTRSVEEIVNRVKNRAGLADAQNDLMGEALVRIFARYCEIVIERLNKVPEKNYRAFLNEIGVSRNPPIAAQVPLTFTPVKSAANTSIVVPRYTKVTAPAGEGESSPVVFETAQAMTLTLAELHRIVTLNTKEDRYKDHDLLISADEEMCEAPPFKGSMPIKHEFYIGAGEAFAANKISSLHLFFSVEEQLPPSKEYILEWRIENSQGGQLLTPDKDTTLELNRSGEIIFNDLPEWEACNISGQKYYWLSCRLTTQVKSQSSGTRIKPPLKLPVIRMIDIAGDSVVEGAKIDYAFFNGLPLDLSKDFFPLGARPVFGDVLYLGCSAFTQSEADVAVKIKLTNPASAMKEPPIPKVNQSGRAVIQWEYWNGKRWEILKCRDDTRALTEDGIVSFRVPQGSRNTEVNGLDGHWIRARLISGHYGLEGNFAYGNPDAVGQGFKYLASTLAPPAIESISVGSFKETGPARPEAIITHNDFVFENIDIAKNKSFAPFRIGHDPIKALYFGFKASGSEIIAGHWLDLYFRVSKTANKIIYRGDQQFPALSWQCWNGKIWQVCKVQDETQSFNITGVVSIFIAEDIASWDETSLGKNGDSLCTDGDASLYWIRAVWVAGDYQCNPVLQRVLLNTTLAAQVMTLNNEILGSGNGMPNQIFYTARTPILDNPLLEVREPQLPSEAQSSRIYREEGKDAIAIIKDAQDQIEEIWVRWHEVNDFLLSNNLDRHFVVERLSGEIRFGDGSKGMLPPLGANNIRLRAYKTGGGTSGNKPVNSIKQLRTSLPLVASVTNPDAAFGGQDIEDWNSVYTRGTSYLRHRGRAVTTEDYEDLARNASRQVARAKCYPNKDLASDSADTAKPGVVSLVVVPENVQAEPRPNLDLLRRIWNFIDQVREQGPTLIVAGPEYVRISVEAVIVPAYEFMEADIAGTCQKRLEAFLHPLTGGENSQGWGFGEKPHESDLYALLESVAGLEYVRTLRIISEEERQGLLESGSFLICSGKHKIHLD